MVDWLLLEPLERTRSATKVSMMARIINYKDLARVAAGIVPVTLTCALMKRKTATFRFPSEVGQLTETRDCSDLNCSLRQHTEAY